MQPHAAAECHRPADNAAPVAQVGRVLLLAVMWCGLSQRMPRTAAGADNAILGEWERFADGHPKLVPTKAGVDVVVCMMQKVGSTR